MWLCHVTSSSDIDADTCKFYLLDMLPLAPARNEDVLKLHVLMATPDVPVCCQAVFLCLPS